MNKKEIIKKFNDLAQIGYLCYDELELISGTIYKLFNKDALNEINTIYTYNKQFDYCIINVICEPEENVYFSFNIIIRFGIDIPWILDDGKFKNLKELPKNYHDIWELLEIDEEE